MKFKTWSHVFFFVPLFLAIYFKIWLTFSLVAIEIPVSFIYHLSGEKKLIRIDMILAYLIIISNLFIGYLNNFSYPFFEAGLLCLLIGLYFQMRREHAHDYNINHGLWHLLASLMTIFSILAFVY